MNLSDIHGRTIRKLRVSLLDACNFRCFYCMPLKPRFMPRRMLLTPSEIEWICSELIEHGIEQIRITGGEPTLRKEFRDITKRIAQLPLNKLGMTTNGFLLQDHLGFLLDIGCLNINVSLDSLNPEKFNRITRSQGFETVMTSIEQAQAMGFHVKINTVLMNGYNNDEIVDFVAFSASTGIEVRFLEAMAIGQIADDKDSLLVPAQKAIELIRETHTLTPVVGQDHDSTSFNFKTQDGANIGFIASETRPFCGACSRWRLSADGFLRACLMSDKGVGLKGVPRAMIERKLSEVLAMKPIHRIKSIHQDMNSIGG